jgi:hypothetical protein
MLDRIPFGGAGRIVANCHDQTNPIRDLVLQVILTGSRHCAVTVAAIRLDQQTTKMVAGYRLLYHPRSSAVILR